jgi:AAT family amino acid transporter/aromatic amino acid transport protein AroP
MQREHLKHKLKNRHVQMIAIGGAIGTGFFLRSSESIDSTGPSIALAYILGGLMVYIIMRALGEMTVEHPTSGAFVEYAHINMGETAGFITGWNSWLLFTLICALELNAASHLLDSWVHIPHLITEMTFLLIFGSLNLMGVRWFGETEFWFSSLKILFIVLMIICGVWVIFTHKTISNNVEFNLENYFQKSQFFTHGAIGFIKSLVVVSFCGVELVSIASGEAVDPRRTTPRAVNGVLTRVLFLYVSTLIIVVLITARHTNLATDNPFTSILTNIGIKNPVIILNIIVIIATLSAFNSFLYGSSRILYRLGLNGHTFKSVSHVTKNGLPRNAIMQSIVMVALMLIIDEVLKPGALMYLSNVCITGIILNWYIILITHIFFRHHSLRKGKNPHYKLPFYPYINFITMLMLSIILIVLTDDKSMRTGIYLTPAWLVILVLIYWIKTKFDNKLKD